MTTKLDNKVNIDDTYKTYRTKISSDKIRKFSESLNKGSLVITDDDLCLKGRKKSSDAVSTNTSEDVHRENHRHSDGSEGPDTKARPTKPQRPVHKTSLDDGGSDYSENSPNISGKFVKVRMGGVRDPQPFKPWEDDINYLFSQDRSKFIGEFHTDEYKIIRGYLQGSGMHLRIYYTKVEPFKKKLATICMIHGLGAHSGRFMDMADFFAKKGFVVNMIDLRGFGLSGCARANANVSELHKDIELLLRQASRNLPLFIYGHGMGAGLVASLLIKNPYLNIAGVILTSGMFGLAKERRIPWLKKWFVKLLGDHLEEVDINPLMTPTGFTHNNFDVKKFLDDKLVVHTVSMRLIKGLFDMMDFILPNAYKFKYPCLIIHGNGDIIHNYQDSIRFYNKISSEDKKLRIFQDGLHDIHLDVDNDLLKEITSEWLTSKITASPKRLGDLPSLRLGVSQKLIPKRFRMLLSILIIMLYFFLLKSFRGQKLYNTKLKLFWYPIFYFYNVLSKKHGWMLCK